MSYPTDLTNVAIYLRKSRADMEAEARGEGETLSKHRRALLEIATKYRYTIDATFEELVSGERIIDRPEMQLLLHSIQEGKYSAVLCMDIDRLGRGNMVDQGIIQDTFKSTNTLIITPRKVYDLQNELDEEWSEFESFMARRELKIITRRMQRGRRMSAAEGKSIAKKPPYGYLRNESLKLYPNPETAPIVKTIFEMAAKGNGYRTIARYLTDRGIPSPSGKDYWDKSMISSILYNNVYLGHIIWGKVHYTKDRLSGGKYNRAPVSEDQWTVKENAHEPLIDQKTYDAAIQMTQSKKTPMPNNAPLANTLASILVCSKCNRMMRYQKKYNRPTNSLLCLTPKCDTRGARFEIVEQRVLETLKQILDGIILESEMSSVSENVNSNAMVELTKQKIKSLSDTLFELNKQKNSLHDFLERGIYDVITFQQRFKILDDRISTTESEIKSAEFELEQLLSEQERKSDFIPKMQKVLEQYHQLETAEEKNKALRGIVEKIIYTRSQEWTEIDHFELDIYLKL